MQKYSHLFFDLDHTLWDFETNSIQTLEELYQKYHLMESFDNFNQFYSNYESYNDELWILYREGKITKERLNFERFFVPLANAGIGDEHIAQNFANDYITVSPTKTTLMPYAIEILTQLKKTHQLHIITNGFKKVQVQKLKNSNLNLFFKNIFISESIGASKPKTAFFEYAVKSSNAPKKKCLIIGDNLETDIDGAINFGLDYVYFNPSKKPHDRVLMHEISSLKELLPLV